MIEIKLDIDGIDYDTLIPKIVPMIAGTGLKGKALEMAVKTKIKNLSQNERNALVVSLINDNKNKIIETLNKKVSDLGIKGYICNVDSDIV